MTAPPGPRRPLLAVTRWVLLGANVLALVLLLTGVDLPGLSTRGFEASASARLVVDRRATVAYDEDTLGRDAVLLTFATLTADPRFTREALAARPLPGRREDYRVVVTNAPNSALVTVAVRGPDAAAVRAVATAVRGAAAAKINALAPLYHLRADADVPPSHVTLLDRARHRRSVLSAVLASCLALAAFWLTRPRAERRSRSS